MIAELVCLLYSLVRQWMTGNLIITKKKKKIRIKRGVVLQIGFENTMERKFEQWRSLKENFNLNDTEDENQKETIVYFGNVIKKKKGKMVK